MRDKVGDKEFLDKMDALSLDMLKVIYRGNQVAALETSRLMRLIVLKERLTIIKKDQALIRGPKDNLLGHEIEIGDILAEIGELQRILKMNGKGIEEK